MLNFMFVLWRSLAQRQPSSLGGMGDAVWSSADAEQLSLRSPDLTLRRLRAPLSEATPQVRRYAALGATRRVGDAGRAATWGRVSAKSPLGGVLFWVARGKSARSRRSRGSAWRPAPSLSVSRAPWAGWATRCGARLTLSNYLCALLTSLCGGYARL